MATIAEVKIKGSGGAQAAKQLDSVGKSTEKLGRQQTRLGQASASAGRQFSAQANGLGGLVGAYAGAAATVFALTAAFQALNNAARFDQIIAGTNALAASLGLRGNEIINQIQTITKGQLTIQEAAESANIALSAGLSGEQIEGLTEVATRASRALGRSLTDSFTRLTRGVAKLEPELLDELGIFTRIEPAAEAYARTLGKTASQLTNFERRQAFANEAITEGISKFGDVDLETTTAAESLEKLSANIRNIGTAIGSAIANFINPLVEIFGSGLPAAFLAASVARLIFGKAIEELTGLLERSRTVAVGFADAITDKIAKASRVGAKETKSLADATQTLALNQTRGSTESKALFNNLVKEARAKKLNADGAAQLIAETERQQRLDQLRLAALQKKTALTAKESAEVARLNQREKELTATKQKAIAVQNAQSASLVRFNKVLRAGANGLISFGTGLLSLVNLVALIVTVVSVIGAIGSAILDSLGLLDDFTDKLREIIDFYKELLGFSDQDILARDTIRTVAENLDLSGIDGFTQVQDAIQKVFLEGGARSAEAFKAALANELETDISLVDQAVGDIVDNIVARFRFLDKDAQQLLGGIAESLGIGAGQAADLLVFAPDKIKAAGTAVLSYNRQLQKTGDATTEVGKQQREFSEAVILSQISQIRLLEGIEKGTLRVEAIDKLRAASSNRLRNIREALGKVTDENLRNELQLQLELAEREDNRLRNLSAQQILIAQNTESIRKQFSAELKNADKLLGVLRLQEDGTVSLARTQREQRTIQIEQLEDALDAGAELLAQRRRSNDLVGDQIKLAEGAEVAEKALLGLFVKTAEELRKINKELEKRNLNLSNQIESALLQLDLIDAQGELKILQNREKSIRNTLRDQRESVELARQRAEQERKTNESILSSQRAIEQNRISTFGNIFSDTAGDDLEIKFREQDLERLERRLRDETAAKDRQLEVTRLLNNELQNNLSAQIVELENVSKIEREQAQLRIDAQINTLKLEQQAIQEKFDLIKIEAEAFNNHIDGLARVLSADLTSRRQLQAGSTLGFASDVANRARGASQSQLTAINEILNNALGRTGVDPSAFSGGSTANAINFGTLGDLLSEAQLREIDIILNQVDIPTIIDERIATPLGTAKESLTKFGSGIDGLKTVLETIADRQSASKLSDQITALTEKINTQSLELAKLDISETDRINNLNDELIVLRALVDALKKARAENSEYNRTINAIAGSVQETTEGALTNFFDTIAEGRFKLSQFKDAFNQFLFDLFEGIRKAILQQTLIDPISEGIGSFAKGAFLESGGAQGGGFFETIAGFFGGGKASGGLVHMAGGGQVRDRVPAMLEPGEFVIRRPMAKAIGGPVLNAMNATGSMPTGDVQVNITNQGTPQEATASQPRFDGEKFVIDIVTRDLRNNGPIRKSLRGGL